MYVGIEPDQQPHIPGQDVFPWYRSFPGVCRQSRGWCPRLNEEVVYFTDRKEYLVHCFFFERLYGKVQSGTMIASIGNSFWLTAGGEETLPQGDWCFKSQCEFFFFTDKS